MHPSILAHILSGALIFLAIYLFFTNRLRNLDSYRMLVLVLLFSITIGVHAISHLGLERAYGYF
jgi:hypothetical protein